jgi:hypothetical protein
MHLRDSAAMRVPAALTSDLITTESNDEVLVYDELAHHIHHLNAVTAKVWRLCDGSRSVIDIAIESGIETEAVRVALHQIEGAKLLESELDNGIRSVKSRRSFMKMAGLASVPAIVSITAPIAKAAASHPSGCSHAGVTCSTGKDAGTCASTCCNGYHCVGSNCSSNGNKTYQCT